MNMKPNLLFNELDSTESTNNYAMEMIHEGLAVHGKAWFTAHQTSGKGQRGKNWEGKPGENIALSIVFDSNNDFLKFPFLFNAWIALICRDYLAELINEKVMIKWPNDIIICDRKAAGILIENKFRGNHWIWSVVGIGINVNQLDFTEEAKNPISLKQISGKTYNLQQMAMELHSKIMDAYKKNIRSEVDEIWSHYHQHLYKFGQKVCLKTENQIIESTILGVNEEGLLKTKDVIERTFQVGQLEWII